MKIFHYSSPRAFLLTLRGHLTGRVIVWSGPKEVAEFRADQIRSCGPDPRKKSEGAQPLATTIEPLPG
jgi:ATP-dependent Clp protease adapter protein ClpS